MSCVNQKQVEPIIIKFENEDETQSNVGKPCIDFQPDDRWHIKDEGEHHENSTSDKLCATLKGSNQGKSQSVTINGESVQSTVKKEKHKNSVNSEVNCTQLTEVSQTKAETKVQTESKDLSSVTKAEPIDSFAPHGEINDSDSNNSFVSNDMMKPENSSECSPVGNTENRSQSCLPNEADLKGISITLITSGNLECSKKKSNDLVGNPQNMLSVSRPGSSNEGKVVENSHDEKIISNCDTDSLGTKHDSKRPISGEPCDKNDCVPSMGLSSIKSEKDLITDINGSDTESKDSIPPELENYSKSGQEIENSSKDMPDLSSDISVSPSDSIKHVKTKLRDDSDEIQVINCVSSDSEGHSPEKVRPVCMSDDFNLFKSLNGVVKAGKYKPVKFPHTGSLTLAENEVIIESPSLVVPLFIKEVDTFPPKEQEDKKDKVEEIKMIKERNALSKNFFQSSVGKFLIGLGTSRVQEWYHRDMKRTRLKQMKKLKIENEKDETHDMHHKAYSEAKAANSVFNFRLRRCQFCDFKSESRIVMESHYLIPHVTPRREYRCNFCPFLTREPREIIFHFEAIHGKKALLDIDVSLHECPFCCFQSRLKTKVTTHINRCRKHFSYSHNQAPPFDFEFPGVTTKPVTISDVMAYHALRMNSSKGRTNQQLSFLSNNTQSAFARKKMASVLSKFNPISVHEARNPTVVKNLLSSQMRQFQQMNTAGIQLPPGIVITRPRSNASIMPNAVRLSVSRTPVTSVQPAGTSRKIFPYLNSAIRSAAPRLGTSELSITPVTKTGVKVLPSSKSVMKNITLTPIGSTGSQLISQKSGQPQSLALFTTLSGNSVTSRNLNSRGVVMSVQSQMARMPLSPKIGSPRVHIPYQRLNTPPSQVVKGSSGNTFVMCEICDSYIKDLEELRTHMNWVHKVKIHPKMLVSRPPLNCQKCQWRFFTDQGLERHLLGAHGLVTTNMQEMANKNQDGGRCIICGAVFTYKLVSHMTQVHKVTLKPAHLSYKCTVCTATFTLYRLFESHVYNVHSGSAKRPVEDSSEPPNKKAHVVRAEPLNKKCKECAKEVDDLEKHLIEKHMKKCSVKLCHIERCEKCLYSSDEMLVIRMSDFGLVESDEDSDDESESESDQEVDEQENEKVKDAQAEKIDDVNVGKDCEIQGVPAEVDERRDEAA